MRAVPGVRRVHDLHVWTLTSGREAMSAHVVVDDVRESERLLETLHALLHARFGIDHTTIQLETAPPGGAADQDARVELGRTSSGGQLDQEDTGMSDRPYPGRAQEGPAHGHVSIERTRDPAPLRRRRRDREEGADGGHGAGGWPGAHRGARGHQARPQGRAPRGAPRASRCAATVR